MTPRSESPPLTEPGIAAAYHRVVLRRASVPAHIERSGRGIPLVVVGGANTVPQA